MGHDAALEPQEPALIIRGGEIGERRQVFERGTPAVDRPQAGGSHRPLQRIDAAFPIGVEDRLIGLGFDRAEAVRTAHVVH